MRLCFVHSISFFFRSGVAKTANAPPNLLKSKYLGEVLITSVGFLFFFAVFFYKVRKTIFIFTYWPLSKMFKAALDAGCKQVTMEKSTNLSAYEWTYEYYYDYLDPVAVDASKLKYNRYVIVIIFWISMAAFIGLLFLILSNISATKHLPRDRKSRRKPRNQNL